MSTFHLIPRLLFICSLHLLSMGANKIREVPDTIGNLSQLQALNLCDNRIEKIPSSVARLHNLKTLSLHRNGIRTLPPELISLKNLTELSLRENPLVERFVQGKQIQSFGVRQCNLLHFRSTHDANIFKGTFRSHSENKCDSIWT